MVLRRTMMQSRKGSQRRSTVPCVAIEIFTEYADKRLVDDQLGCELQGGDLIGRQYRMVRIKGLKSSWARKNNITSGATTLFAPDGAFIDDDTSELLIPYGATIKVRCHIGADATSLDNSWHGLTPDTPDEFAARSPQKETRQ